MMRTVFFHNESTRNDITPDELEGILSKQEGLLWVSLEDETDETLQHVLGDLFQFHPLSIEDCQSNGYQTPKVDDFRSYLFLIMHALIYDSTTQQLETRELDIFLSKHYLVTTYQGDTMPAVDTLWSLAQRDERLHQNGADFLCHALLDILIDDYTPVLDQIEDTMELMEDNALDNPKRQVLDEIIHLKHTMMTLRRIVSPEREVILRLTRNEFSLISPACQIYFRDVYDHLVRLHEMIDGIRDIAGGALEIYLNSTSLRLNEVMKALTIVSTIFLPLSFVAGVYGMNFKHMPELSWWLGYPLVWLVFVLIAGGMLTFFRRKGWF